MKARMFLLRGAMISLFAGLAAVGLGATYTWNEAVSGNWTNKTSWSPSGIPGSADTVYFFNTATGTCNITSNGVQKVSIVYFNATNTSQTIAISPGATWAPTTFNQCNYVNSTNQVVINGGGTFAPGGVMTVAYANTSIAPSNSLTLDNVTWDSSSMSSLTIGSAATLGHVIGTLIATNATLTFQGSANTLGTKSGNMTIGYNTYGAGAGRDASGFLYLPGTVTNISIAGQLILGADRNATSSSVLDLGVNPALNTITASGGISLLAGIMTYNNGAQTGFPPNVSMNIGTPSAYQNFTFHYVYGSAPAGLLYYTNTMSAFNCWLSSLQVAQADSTAAGRYVVVMDLSEHAVTNKNWTGSLTATSLTITNLGIGYSAGNGYGNGYLYLPSSLTNFWVKDLYMGWEGANPTPAPTNTVNFGTNTSGIAFTVANSLNIGCGASFQSVSGAVTSNAFPMGSTFTMGAPGAPATSAQIGRSFADTIQFGRGFTNVSVYCQNYTVGGCLTINANDTVNNDFRDAVNLKMVAVNALQIGVNQGDAAYMYLPANSSVACSNIAMGANANSAYAWYVANLNMSNTTIAVSNSVALGQTATVTNYINGISSGFDIGAMNFTVAGTNTPSAGTRYGRMALVFVRDPVNTTQPYWGLRLKGNAVGYLQSLTNTPSATTLASHGFLTWTTNGLSAKAQSRFGIQYDTVKDYTYVGVSPAVSGTSVFFR